MSTYSGEAPGSLLEELAREAGQSIASLLLQLALHAQFHGDLARLLDDALLAGSLLDLALLLLVVEELAGLGHGEGEEAALRVLLALCLARVEELEGLHGGRGAEALLVGLLPAVAAARGELLERVEDGRLVDVALFDRRLVLAQGAEDAREEVLVAVGARELVGLVGGGAEVVVVAAGEAVGAALGLWREGTR